MTLAEIFYDSLRRSGRQNANDLFEDVTELPIHVAWNLTPELIERGGHFKTTQRISFADCFVLALAEMEKATVVSTDHHEFDVIEQKKSSAFFGCDKEQPRRANQVIAPAPGNEPRRLTPTKSGGIFTESGRDTVIFSRP